MSLFTVEQLELIRRLRATNITPQQIADAFNQLDQMREEDNQTANSMPELSCEPSSSTAQSPVLLQHLRSQPPVPVTISASSPVVCSSPERLTVQTVPLASTAQQQGQQQSPPAPVPFLLSKYEQNSCGRPIRSQRTPMNDIIVLDDPSELDEFMLQGEEGCIADMKKFINQYSLRQTTVATMTGVSQPYISKLLNGNHRELSLRCRKNIYCWYLNCRRHPEKLASFLADPSTRLETNSDGELVPQRRERYVFRPILIRLLDGFFTQTPFPDMNKRIEIAAACNHVLQLDKKGVGLMPKEVVSPQVVANWFANKRKEFRRRSHDNDTCAQLPNSNSGPNGEETGVNHDEQNSNLGSTPSPLSDPCDNQMSQNADVKNMATSAFPLATDACDMATLASRLGLTLPQSTSSSSPPLTQPIASLASQLLATSQSIASSNQPMMTLANQMLNNSQISFSNPLSLLQPFTLVGNENQQLNLNTLAMAYDQLRAPMIKMDNIE